MSDVTTPSEQSEDSGRKFDDVASLFGSIVPAPGSPVRSVRQFKPLSVVLPEPSGSPIVPPPLALSQPEDDPAPVPSGADLVVEPPPAIVAPPPVERPASAVPRRREIPWPDAFEPRPNYRKPEPRNWSWLLLIPVGLVAAFGVSVIDTRALKGWVDTNLLHRTLIAASPNTSLLPAPFRNDAGAVATLTPEIPDLTPALPTSPVPVPPGTEVSPPPVDVVEHATAPPVHITIQYRRGVPGADGEARRMAALLQNTGGSVELHPNATTVKSPTIMFYNPSDKPSATALALVLANEVAAWTVRQGTMSASTSGPGKTPPGSIDIWMP